MYLVWKLPNPLFLVARLLQRIYPFPTPRKGAIQFMQAGFARVDAILIAGRDVSFVPKPRTVRSCRGCHLQL
jgi:hypothetical protein